MVKLIPVAATLFALTACTVQTSPTRTGPGGLEVEITDGQNCYANKCFRYDPARNAVSVQGRVAVLAGNVGDFVTPATFNALHATALRARFKTSGRGG